MKKIVAKLALLTLILGVFTVSCAKRGMITGGPKDTIAPKIIRSNPENYSTNFDGKEIKIHFNELIKVKDITKQLIISPPLSNQPIIVPQGSASSYISVKLNDTLQKNTTYSFNFGQSITDNNEGNPYSQFKFVFSTGSTIDSLTIVGKIKDAYQKKPDNFVSVMLYDAEKFKDSTIYKEKPLYVTNTLDSLKAFALENLREGKYFLVALKDKNNNYKFDPKTDKIGFQKDFIKIPTDTIYELELFKEKLAFKAEKPIQQTNTKLYLGFQGDSRKTVITAKKGSLNIPIKVTDFAEKGKDSLQIYIPETITDSIEFEVKNGNYLKSFMTKLKKIKEKDSLDISAVYRNILPFNEKFILKSSLPISNFDSSKIKLFNKDSVAVPYTLDYNEFEKNLIFDFKKEEKQKYHLVIEPNAIVDFYNNTTKETKFDFSTISYSDYGNLRVNLKNVNRFPVIIEILDNKGEIVASKTSSQEKYLEFNLINPSKYTLRAIYDDNKNNEWDTGIFLERKQAEEIIYFPNEIDVKANWDVEQEFDLE